MSRRKRYSAEFKRETLKRANEEGVTDVLVAEELGINARQLRRWREAAKREGDKAIPGQGCRCICAWLCRPGFRAAASLPGPSKL